MNSAGNVTKKTQSGFTRRDPTPATTIHFFTSGERDAKLNLIVLPKSAIGSLAGRVCVFGNAISVLGNLKLKSVP